MDNMQSLIKQFQGTDIGIIAVGTTPLAYKRELQFVTGVDNIRVSLGFHPQLVKQRGNEIDLFLQQLEKARYIGEIGLDFNQDYMDSKMQQFISFQKIVERCAIEGDKVLSIHSVKAAVENGAYFSVNSKMLKTKSGQETIRNIPANRILLETDAPFAMKFNTIDDLHSELRAVARKISLMKKEIRNV